MRLCRSVRIIKFCVEFNILKHLGIDKGNAKALAQKINKEF